uniref:Uncharacterized protein n=1 Tax=Branchiostoma floridae TaxID=7739 RepID=C3ZD09_BRAFL|eukprot:XP_002593509.1 hypothetical protein BRAFLDRAFT_101842 [Branchiostoma floridae]
MPPKPPEDCQTTMFHTGRQGPRDTGLVGPDSSGAAACRRRAGPSRGAVLPAYITGLSVPIFCSHALKHQLSKPQRPSPRDRLPSATPAHRFLWTPRFFVMLTEDL